MTAIDDKRLLIVPRWMLDHVEQPVVDLSSFPQDELNERVLAKTTNDRLPIHLGPLLYLFKKRSEFDKYTWHSSNTDEFIIDLAKLPNGYPLQSGETIVAASAEYFEFPDDLAGIVISRVGNHLSGIDVSTTFIDAGWPGIITFQITNVDSHPRLLKLGLEIARLFVFELSSPQKDARRYATEGSHHAGASWTKIFEGSRSPFDKVTIPERLLAGPTPEQPKNWRNLRILLKFIEDCYYQLCKKCNIPVELSKHFVFAITIILLFAWSPFRQPIIDVAESIGKFVEAWRSIASLTASAPERKVVRITVKKGDSVSSIRLPLNEDRIKKGAIPMAIVRPSGFRQELAVKSVDVLVGNDNRDVDLKVKLMKEVSSDTVIDIEYVIFWRDNEGDIESPVPGNRQADLAVPIRPSNS